MAKVCQGKVGAKSVWRGAVRCRGLTRGLIYRAATPKSGRQANGKSSAYFTLDIYNL
jgi:hypothetical protein